MGYFAEEKQIKQETAQGETYFGQRIKGKIAIPPNVSFP
jgi:hypothetical protein